MVLTSSLGELMEDQMLQYYQMVGARGVVVIVVGNGHGDTSSNPGRDWLHFTFH